MAYPNGEVPFNKLVHLGANFWLPPGTAARWAWFVREGIRRFGVTFRITPDRDGLGGWNAYRPLSAQILYRNKYGNMAAVPRYSSHGGWYRNQEVFAIDVDNWMVVPWASFAALANEAGFRVNFVSPEERWHIGDFNNPWVVPAFTIPATPEINVEDDSMHSIAVNGKVYSMAKQFISHNSTIPEANITRQVTSATDELHKLNQEQFTNLLDGLGIPRYALDKDGYVLNPQSKLAYKYENGGTWSREREILAALKVA
ncbi:endolysin [Microbacterium phage Pavlo]|nr:lysin A [Microbacterium phage Lupine]QDK03299.1 lysin A [Microbacterium phage Roman]QIG58602.1 lysin A [Microbacterium phage Hubbs]UVG34113.1 endolysin [Microbacterium phage Pavlo]